MIQFFSIRPHSVWSAVLAQTLTRKLLPPTGLISTRKYCLVTILPMIRSLVDCEQIGISSFLTATVLVFSAVISHTSFLVSICGRDGPISKQAHLYHILFAHARSPHVLIAHTYVFQFGKILGATRSYRVAPKKINPSSNEPHGPNPAP